MKQTNNAIKFLMAQYRAIFKNANIAMVAAMAAAALAAGQAQAADPGADGTNPLGKFENELKDSTIGSGDNLTHDAKKWVVLSAPANKPIKVENGGKLTLQYDGTTSLGHIYTGNDLVVNSGGTITLKGSTDAKAEIAGLVGVAKETAGVNTAVPTASLTINKDGKLDVTSSFAMMKDVNINGGTVNIGGSTGKNTVGDNAYLKYAAVYAEAGDLTVAGDAQVNLKAASHLYGQNVAINGGTINFEGTSAAGVGASGKKDAGALLRAGDSKNGGTLTVSNGKLNVAQGKSGDIVATTLNMKGGEINVSGTMGISGNYHSNAPVANINVTGGKVTVANGGTLGLDGNASFADGTLTNAGTVAVAIAQDGTRSLTLGSKAFSELLKGKLTATGVTSAGTETFNIVVDGDADLVTSGFLTADGAINTTHAEFTDLDASSLTAKNVTIVAASYSGATAIKADSLVAGKAGAFAIKSGSTVEVAKGLTVTPNGETKDLTVNGILNLSGAGGNVAANITLASADSSSPKLNVNKGVWNLQDLKLTSGAAVVDGEGTEVNIAGTLTTTQTNGTLAIKNNALVNASEGVLNLAEATVALTGGSTLVLDGNDVFKIAGGSASLTDGQGDNKSKYVQGAVTTDSTSVLQLKYTGQLSLANIESIKTAMDKSNGLAGFIKFEGATITDKPKDDVAIGEIKPGVDGIYNDVTVTVGTGGDVSQTFTAGQIKLTDNSNTAAVANDKTVMLTGSKGDFVVKSGGEAADASLGNGSSLVLAGNGAIGAINGSQAKSGAVSIGHSSLGTGTVTAKEIGGTQAVKSVDVFNSKLNVAGKVATDSLSLEDGSSLNITAAAGSGSITADTLSVDAASSISAAGQAISVGGTTNGATKILGDVTAKSLTYAGSGDHIIAGDAVVNLDTLDFGTSTVQIGDDAAEANGSATVVVKNLSGTGTLFVDPKYGDDAALVIAESLDALATPESNDAGTFSGKAIIGNNAALGIGFASEAELKAVLGQFLDADGSFTETPAADKLEIANALVLNKQIKIDSSNGIVVQKGATKTTPVTGDSVTLDAGTGLIVTDNVYSVQADGTKSGSAITFGSNATVNGGGKVILSGNFDGKDDALQIFNAGTNTVTVSGTLAVQSANGLLKGEINGTNKGTVDLNVDETVLKDAFTGVSAPVAELLKNTIRGEYKGAKGLGADFVYTVAGTSLTGAEVDAAAHAATYAGAQQAAVAAVTTMADAMFGRVGAVGVEAASISATGSQANGGVWLTPMYKSVDSDGFNAEGVSYGSDVDLAGVAFGTDTVNGNMRFGAVFNIGSGDADGKGQGNGLKDEFDYYGFGIYSAMGFGNFALVGDASMTVISHDVEGFGLKGKADTTAVTMGVTGQYTVATPMVDVTPHLGARFIRLNTDSYDLTSADGVLATTDFDVQNVFSVPVGVTLSKAFVAGGWSLAPSADLTIAFNTGDTDAKSNTQFNSSKPMSVATNTEVLDEVTYGLTLGLGAQYGAFGTSFGINYTGSSNTDSLGVNAQARYMF
ncbi:MAG: autotransporter outer membrane beta-barrel domain-containing protein [Anaerobiospirillum succiniciproducens]|uniref:beta strand repeat-containing protein n=1 Tax=Anaerobiospirillum succiniciproducens TaxID=13335 RepID=UPI002A74A598|nr:autotransporter outer membrane beta-barrel domain-containing protein [Anaerobiospirillum succiniciproducens]MDY2797578.1 autotransporter outer membrane beta-barrel domain-containing protein [Anaerobiospirillum succiniciproducens]